MKEFDVYVGYSIKTAMPFRYEAESAGQAKSLYRKQFGYNSVKILYVKDVQTGKEYF